MLAQTDAVADVAVGRVVKPFGLKGEVVVKQYNPALNPLAVDRAVLVGGAELRVLSLRKHTAGNLVVRFGDFASATDAETVRGCEIFMRTTDLPKLGAGNYYHYELIGLAVRTASGDALGKLSEIMDTDGNSVYVIKAQDGTEILVPAIADAVKEVDIAGKIMVVERDFCVTQTTKQRT